MESINLDCIKTSVGLTGKVHYNICSGSQIFTPYGILDYIAVASVLIAFMVLLGFTYLFFKELVFYKNSN